MRRVSQLCGIVAAALIGLGVLVVCEMVFVRYALNQNTIWQTDFVTWSLVAATFVGSPYVLLTRGHVNVDVLPHYLGPRGRWWLALASIVMSLAFLLIFQGFGSLQVVAETFYAGLNDFTLVSIPMFVMMGAAIGSSPAGRDLYEALDRWLYRLPGGLVISNLGACALFAALTGSSPACCAAIGKMGIPEMRRRGYPDEIATGSICAGGTLGILIPPSITFILYGIATETSIGRLFLAGVVPGLMLTGLFMLWTLFAIWRRGFLAHAPAFRYSWKEKFQSVPKVAPFLAIIVGVMYVLYGGVATPSLGAAGGAALCVVLAVLLYRRG